MLMWRAHNFKTCHISWLTRSHPPTKQNKSPSQPTIHTHPSSRPAMTEHPAKKRKMESDGSDTEQPPEKKSLTTSPSPESYPSETALSSPLPSSKYTRGDQVTLVIGPDEQELVVCQHFLVKTSKFFEVALKKQWEEGQTRIIKLPEDDVEIVTLYLDFMHGEGLPSQSIKRAEDIPYGSSDMHPNRLLVGLYSFSERVLSTTIQNAIIKEFLRFVTLTLYERKRNVPSLHAISEIYKGTTDGSPARRLMVDLYLAYAQPGALANTDNNPAFVRDVAHALLEKAAYRTSPNEFRFRGLKVDDYMV